MPRRTSKTGSGRLIVDNSDRQWKVQKEKYLHDWCQLSHAIDVATGYFEIGGLLALGGEWQKADAPGVHGLRVGSTEARGPRWVGNANPVR
jgi:hypothetical protein